MTADAAMEMAPAQKSQSVDFRLSGPAHPFPLALTPERTSVILNAAADGRSSPDLVHALDDMLQLVGCLMALDEPDASDRWMRERQSYEALARARRSLHRCAQIRGLA